MNNSVSKKPPSIIDVWTKAHTKKNDEPMNSTISSTFVRISYIFSLFPLDANYFLWINKLVYFLERFVRET